MNDKPSIDHSGQVVQNSQTNIAGDVQGPVFSGQFQGPFIYKEAAQLRLPLQKPPRVQHFTGRNEELASLLKDLQPGQVVTICGPGGMGKTALAAEAIWQLAPENDPPQRFPDGIFFHTFYHKPQVAQALESIARAYGEDPRQSPLEAAKRALAGRIALIVLDGTEACDDLEIVLSVTISCGVLITTRRHSDAPADFSDLPPLPMDEAVQLLQAWGEEMASEAKTCQSICNLLGCLPLAIFLVGRYMAHKRQLASEYLAWLEKTSLIALDLGKRQHQSIPLLMEHSLLQVSEQAQSCLGLTGALALKPFEPGIIAIALEVSVEEANHSLGDLVDFGLLTRPDVRYQITHALAHTYARERLAPPGNSLTRLAEYYDDFIHKETQLGLCGYVLLDGQRDHILAVQSACNKAGLWKAVRTLAWAIEDYLDLQGHWVERIAILQAGLVAARSDEARYDEASFFNSLGLAYRDMGEPRKAIEYYEQAQKIAREIGYRRGEGYHLGNLGNAYRNLGEPRKAIEYYEQALKIFREIGSMRGEGTALGNLGLAYFALGQSFKAIEYYEQALKIFREIGDRRGEGTALGNLGNAYSDLGQPSKAIEYRDQTLKIAREMGDRSGEARASWNLGLEYETAGDLRRAADLMQVDIEFKRKIGHPDAEKDAEYLENLRARIEKK